MVDRRIANFNSTEMPSSRWTTYQDEHGPARVASVRDGPSHRRRSELRSALPPPAAACSLDRGLIGLIDWID